jgi:hypothetical protein
MRVYAPAGLKYRVILRQEKNSEICKQKNGVPKYVNSPEVYKTFDVRRLGLADLD